MNTKINAVNLTLMAVIDDKKKSFAYSQLNPRLSEEELEKVAGAFSTLIPATVEAYKITKEYKGEGALLAPQAAPAAQE